MKRRRRSVEAALATSAPRATQQPRRPDLSTRPPIADPFDLGPPPPPIVTIYFFHSPFCGACQAAHPILDAWANTNNVPVIDRNVAADENASMGGWEWTGTPAYVLMVNGTLGGKPHVGGLTKMDLDRWYKKTMDAWEKKRGAHS
jgi:thiol-disulfide isomerase/thioredoxin